MGVGSSIGQVPIGKEVFLLSGQGGGRTFVICIVTLMERGCVVSLIELWVMVRG